MNRNYVKIVKPIGSKMTFTGGEESFSPTVEVIPSTYHNKDPGDKVLSISVKEVSLDTLMAICDWASKE